LPAKRVKSADESPFMPDENLNPATNPAVSQSAEGPAANPPEPVVSPATTKPPGLDLGPGVGINVTEDMAAPERKLPPTKILLITIAGLAVVLAIWGFLGRAKPQGMGSVDNIAAIEIPNQNAMLVAVTVTLHNSGEKPLWIHSIKGKLRMPDKQEYSDDAASAVDFDRYFEAFPSLKQNSLPALMPETKILPGNEAKGTVIVSFPVKQEDFDKRQSLSVSVQPYDQPLPVVLTK
jgi:hypothetical protein